MENQNTGVDPGWAKRRELWDRFSEACLKAYEAVYDGTEADGEPYVLLSLFGGDDGNRPALDILSNLGECLLPSAAELFKVCAEGLHTQKHKREASVDFENVFPDRAVVDAKTLGELIEEHGDDPILRILSQILPQGQHAVFVESTDLSDVRDLPEAPEPNIQKGDN